MRCYCKVIKQLLHQRFTATYCEKSHLGRALGQKNGFCPGSLAAVRRMPALSALGTFGPRQGSQVRRTAALTGCDAAF